MICFGATPTSDKVFTKGISEITKDDFSWAKRLGKTIKLVAVVDNEGGFNARVTPVLLDIKHPLASIRGALNAVVIEGENVNQLVFSGPGAGAAPTASAIIGDVLSACHQINSELSNWSPLRENHHGEKAFEKFRISQQEQDDFVTSPAEVEEGVLECKCGSKRTISFTLQTRSGDEGTSVWARCVECGNKWQA